MSQLFIPSAFTRQFVSAPQSIALNGLSTIAHGLGIQPKMVTLEYVCVTAEQGYSIGDEVYNVVYGFASVAGSYNAFCSPDATNLLVRIGTLGISWANKTTGAVAAMTPLKWNVIARAYA